MRVDVAVVGDGPAGSGLAAACAQRGVEVALIGPGDVWRATYAAWTDELDGLPVLTGADVFATRCASVAVWGSGRIAVDRAYGVIDNGRLRDVLTAAVSHRRSTVERIDIADPRVLSLADGSEIRARVVVDVTGWPSRLVGGHQVARAHQTAFGVMLEAAPPGDLGEPVLMDFRSPGAPTPSPTFAYSLPTGDGWIVEETVLAARPAVDPALLRAPLAGRIGESVVAGAPDTEVVRIPMGVPRPGPAEPIVRFGAAAGMVHPATGYSVTSSLRAVDRVADSIATELGRSEIDVGAVAAAVWPDPYRRTRALHDYGLEVLTGLDRSATAEFFGAFFELPVDVWSPYMRVDAEPAAIRRTMRALFRSAPWALRRRLATGNPRRLAQALRGE